MSLYRHAQHQLVQEYKVLGAFHGVEFGTEQEQTQKQQALKTDNRGIIPFGDPDSYKDMSEAEREALSVKMFGPLSEWAKDPIGKKSK